MVEASDDDPLPAATNDPAVAKLRSQVLLQHARRTKAFWNLPLIHYLGCVGHSIIIVHVVLFATIVQEIPLLAASSIVTVYTLSSVGSRLFTPILADLWGAKPVMVLPYVIQGVTVPLLFWTQELWQFYVFAVVFGVGFGGEMSAFLIANRQYYGMGPVRSIFGFQHMGSGLGMALGGMIGAVIFDTFGSYDLAWIVSIAASMGGMARACPSSPSPGTSGAFYMQPFGSGPPAGDSGCKRRWYLVVGPAWSRRRCSSQHRDD